MEFIEFRDLKNYDIDKVFVIVENEDGSCNICKVFCYDSFNDTVTVKGTLIDTIYEVSEKLHFIDIEPMLAARNVKGEIVTFKVLESKGNIFRVKSISSGEIKEIELEYPIGMDIINKINMMNSKEAIEILLGNENSIGYKSVVNMTEKGSYISACENIKNCINYISKESEVRECKGICRTLDSLVKDLATVISSYEIDKKILNCENKETEMLLAMEFGSKGKNELEIVESGLKESLEGKKYTIEELAKITAACSIFLKTGNITKLYGIFKKGEWNTIKYYNDISIATIKECLNLTVDILRERT